MKDNRYITDEELLELENDEEIKGKIEEINLMIQNINMLKLMNKIMKTEIVS